MLEERGSRVERQVSVAFDFNGMHFDEGGNSSMNVEDVSSVAVDTAFHLHRDLGPGLLESVYEAQLS